LIIYLSDNKVSTVSIAPCMSMSLSIGIVLSEVSEFVIAVHWCVTEWTTATGL